MPHRFSLDNLLLDAELPPRSSEPPILMVHGLSGGSWYFAKWLQFFASRGHPSYAVNLRGHHGSRPVEHFGRVSILDYVTDVRDASRELRQALDHRPGGHAGGRNRDRDRIRRARQVDLVVEPA